MSSSGGVPQVLSHIAEALRDIHAKNYVHGHVKPAHILHLRQDNRWTLTDFDRAASVGCPVPPVATLEYTSPENMHAAASGAEAVPASPAADCWALGVVAFELLTNTKALKPSDDGAAAVRAFFRHAHACTPGMATRRADHLRHRCTAAPVPSWCSVRAALLLLATLTGIPGPFTPERPIVSGLRSLKVNVTARPCHGPSFTLPPWQWQWLPRGSGRGCTRSVAVVAREPERHF